MLSSKLKLLQIENQLKTFSGNGLLYKFLRGYSSGSYLQYGKNINLQIFNT